MEQIDYAWLSEPLIYFQWHFKRQEDLPRIQFSPRLYSIPKILLSYFVHFLYFSHFIFGKFSEFRYEQTSLTQKRFGLNVKGF